MLLDECPVKIFGVINADVKYIYFICDCLLVCCFDPGLCFRLYPARPVEECVVTLGGYGGKAFEVTPNEGTVVGAPLALTITPGTGEPVR